MEKRSKWTRLSREPRSSNDGLRMSNSSPLNAPGYLDLFARMSGEENRVILTSGNKVIYPSQGPCLIGPVIMKVIDGRQISFYQLALLDDSGGELLVPVDKVQTIGIRPLLKRYDIPKVLGMLEESRGAEQDW